MSYTPNTWATGDTITAEKLNNMEQGIASAGGGGDFTAIFTQTITPGNPPTFSVTCDKTFAEITAANEAGTPINMLLTNGATTTRLLYNITPSSIVVTILQIVEAQSLLTLGVYTMAADNTITMHTYGCEVTQMM